MDRPLYLVVALAYLGALLLLGLSKARSVKTQEDFSVAGRKLSGFVVFGTLLATWVGTGSLFGNAEETVRIGVTAFVLPVGGVLAVAALAFLAARVRRFSGLTVLDILEARYGPASRSIGALTLVVSCVVIVSYQYRAAGAVIAAITPETIGPAEGTAIAAAFIIAYTALAGLFSVAYTDVANGVVMIAGLAVAAVALHSEAGGFAGARTLLPPERFAWRYSSNDLLGALVPAFLLLLGDPNMYQRFFSARSARAATAATIALVAALAVVESLIVFVAFFGSALAPARGGLENPAHVIVFAAFHELPPAAGAILLAAILAVIVSTADSYLLVVATAAVRDVWRRLLPARGGPASFVRDGRIAVVLLGVLAYGQSLLSDDYFGIARYAYSVYGCGVTPALLAAFFWRRATARGGLASVATGTAVAVAWRALSLDAATGVHGALVGFPAAVGALVLVSLAGPPPPESAWRPFASRAEG